MGDDEERGLGKNVEWLISVHVHRQCEDSDEVEGLFMSTSLENLEFCKGWLYWKTTNTELQRPWIWM